MKKLLLSLTVLSFIAFSSCKEKETELSRTEYLTSANWQLVSGTIVPPVTVELFGQVITISDFMDITQAEACNRDDLQIFNSDGTITNDEGPTKCDPADPQTSSGGTWMFMSNDTKLRIVDGDTTDITITELNKTTMKGNTSMEFEDAEGNPAVHTINFTFTNKK